MAFSIKQVRALGRDVQGRHVRTREIRGKELSYVEGWHVIAEANRIFGYDAWDRETQETKCVHAREMQGRYSVVYTAKVRVIVRAGGQVVYRDGQGTGEAQGATLGEAHDKALKSAETDATKRALATFGRPFGLSLYLRTSQPKSVEEGLRVPVANGGAQQKVASAVVETQAPRLEDAQMASALNDIQPSPISESTDSKFQAEMQTGTVPGEQEPLASEQSANIREASVISIGFAKRLRDKAHLQHVRQQPCLVCGRQSSDAHHLRFAQSKALGRKVSDEFTVPLCRNHHRKLHHFGNEVTWWQAMKIDPLPVARKLWEESRRHRGVVEGARLS